MSDSRQKMGAKLAGKHLLGFDTQNILADSPELLRMNSSKVSEPPKTVSAKVGEPAKTVSSKVGFTKQSVVERGIDNQTHS